jgi:hypothetical protein
VETKPSVLLPRLKLHAKGAGFFETITDIDSTPDIEVEIVIGTTAPFSAMSGALILMSELSAVFTEPNNFSKAESILLAANEDSGHAANTAFGVNKPALTAMPAIPLAKVPLRKVLRFMMYFSPI